MKNSIEKAVVQIDDKSTNDNVNIEKVKLCKYHSLEYLKNKYKGKKFICILPNGKEVEING